LYNKASEGGIIYNDASIGINWQIDTADLLLSEKDAALPTLNEIKDKLYF
jgi:dTDP-4-dehydrorhamnose 3,5-epimerase